MRGEEGVILRGKEKRMNMDKLKQAIEEFCSETQKHVFLGNGGELSNDYDLGRFADIAFALAMGGLETHCKQMLAEELQKVGLSPDESETLASKYTRDAVLCRNVLQKLEMKGLIEIKK